MKFCLPFCKDVSIEFLSCFVNLFKQNQTQIVLRKVLPSYDGSDLGSSNINFKSSINNFINPLLLTIF